MSFLNKVPGFRSNTGWKKVVAIIGYTLIFLTILVVIFSSGMTAEELASAKNYEDGLRAFEAGNYNAAKIYFNKVIPTDPNYEDAQKKIQEIELIISAESYNRGIEYFNNEDYAKAKTEFNKVIESDPNYNDAQKKLNEAELAISAQEYEEGVKSFDAEDYDAAMDHFKRVIEVFSLPMRN